MPERVRAREGALEEPRPTPEDVRRRLEGRAEVIETALPRYRKLEGALKGRRWQQRLRKQPSLVAEVLEREAVLPEALERVRRRAESEGWPEDTPLLQAARELEPLRERLGARVRERLESLVPVSGAPALGEDLRRLGDAVRQTVSFLSEPGETFSLHSRSGTQWPRYAGFVTTVQVVACLALLMGGALAPGLLGLAMVLLPVVTALALWRLRPGDFWLTPRRLVWMPPGGEAVAVRLASIPEGGIRVAGPRGGLLVEGDRRVHVPRLGKKRAWRLRVLLELYRHVGLEARAALVEHAVDAVCFPALLRRGGRWHQGQCVLMKRMLFFFPGQGAGPALLRAATGLVLDTPVELSWVMEGLRWQPESDLGAYLLRVAKATRGAAWSADFARHFKSVPLEHEVHITYEDEVIVGRLARGDVPAAGHILASWK
jgi:hypothetical protein